MAAGSPTGLALLVNAFRVEFSFASFNVWEQPYPEGCDLAEMRAEHAGDWRLYRDGATLAALALHPRAAPPPGEQVERKTNASLRLLSNLVVAALPDRFPAYRPLKRFRFVFVGHRKQLLEGVADEIRGLPALATQFLLWPKYEFNTKIMEVRAGQPFVAVTVVISMRSEITANLAELEAAGVDLRGLYVVRRDPDPVKRQLLGRIRGVAGTTLVLDDACTDVTVVEAADAMLEGSTANSTACLKTLLGVRYETFEAFKERRVVDWTSGPAVKAEVARVGDILRGEPLVLADGLDCCIAEQVVVQNRGDFKSVVQARPVAYCYDSMRSKQHKFAWAGLDQYGPFSRDTFARPSPRLLVLYPEENKGQVEAFLRSLFDGLGIPRSAFAKGMTRTFGLVNPSYDFVAVGRSAGGPADAYRRSIEDYLARADRPPDAAVVVVGDADALLADHLNPYLHAKAALLMGGVACQEVRVGTLRQTPTSLQYTLQSFAIALYAKMNGIPWTVDHDLTIADELVIGVGNVELAASRSAPRQRFVGITTVFRGDGNYLLGQLSAECAYEDYPDELRRSTLEALNEVKRRNAWQPGDTVRVIFHAARPPRNVDLAVLAEQCAAAVGSEQHIEFAALTVSHAQPFTLFDPAQRGVAGLRGATKAEFVPARGLIVQSDRYSRLVCTTSPAMVKRPGLPVPRPLAVHLHKGSTFTDLDYLAEQVLKFTSLSWRSTLPSGEPVSILYSELIAGLLARLRSVPGWAPGSLNGRLRTSKWFL